MRRRDLLVAGSASFAGAVGTGMVTGLFRRPPNSGYGSRLDLGDVLTLRADLDGRPGRMKYLRDAHAYLVRYDPQPDRPDPYGGITAAGFMAIAARCTHLGCTVPFCESSGWLECLCHGARFNRLGEYEFGPAPRGLDRFRLSVRSELAGRRTLVVDTRFLVTGPPRGVESEDSTPLGPHCED